MSRSIGKSALISGLLGYLGLSDGDLRIVSMPNAAKIDALRSGGVDMAILVEPEVARARQSGLTVWLRSSDWQSGADFSYIVLGSRLLSDDRDLGRRFVAAYAAGVADYRAGKTPTNLRLLAQETKLAPELLDAACWAAVRAGGVVDLDSVSRYLAWAVRSGLLVDRAPSPGEMIDGALLEEASRLGDEDPM